MTAKWDLRKVSDVKNVSSECTSRERNSIYRKAWLTIFSSFAVLVSLFGSLCLTGLAKLTVAKFHVFSETRERASHIVSLIALFTNNTHTNVVISTCSFSLQNLYIVRRQVMRLKEIINFRL